MIQGIVAMTEHSQKPEPTQDLDHVTVLRCRDASSIAAKRWYQPQGASKPLRQDFSLGSTFRVTLHPVSGIADLSALLTTLEEDRSAFVIRGEPKPGVDLD